MQLHRAQFLACDTIQGSCVKGQVLQYLIKKSTIWIRCGGTPFRESLPRENGKGERYLVYRKGRKNSSQNHFQLIHRP